MGEIFGEAKRIDQNDYPVLTNRDGDLTTCFDEEDDFRQYLQWPKQYAGQYLLNIWATAF